MTIKEKSWVEIPAGTPCRHQMRGILKDVYDSGGVFEPNGALKENQRGHVSTVIKIKGVKCGIILVYIDGAMNGRDLLVETDSVTEIKTGPLKRDLRVQMTNGSKWKITNTIDVAFTIMDRYGWQWKTLEAGTIMEVVNKKITSNFVGTQMLQVKIDGKGYLIFVPFLNGNLELAKAGEQRVYWKLYDKDGEVISTKRFKTLTSVKKSVRYHTNDFEKAGQTDEAYWLDNPDAKPFDNWYTVEYDAATDNVLNTIDLMEWFVTHRLTTDYDKKES